jgi:hypothetical protein
VTAEFDSSRRQFIHILNSVEVGSKNTAMPVITRNNSNKAIAVKASTQESGPASVPALEEPQPETMAPTLEPAAMDSPPEQAPTLAPTLAPAAMDSPPGRQERYLVGRMAGFGRKNGRLLWSVPGN